MDEYIYVVVLTDRMGKEIPKFTTNNPDLIPTIMEEIVPVNVDNFDFKYGYRVVAVPNMTENNILSMTQEEKLNDYDFSNDIEENGDEDLVEDEEETYEEETYEDEDEDFENNEWNETV